MVSKGKSVPHCWTIRKSEKSILLLPTSHSQPLSFRAPTGKRNGGWEALKVLEKKRGQVSSLPIKTAPAPEPGSLLQLFLTFRARERNWVCFWSLSNPSYLILSIRMNISSPKVATLRRNMVALKNYYHSTQSSPIWREGLVNNCLQLRWSQWNWTIQLQSCFWDLLAVNLQQVS